MRSCWRCSFSVRCWRMVFVSFERNDRARESKTFLASSAAKCASSWADGEPGPSGNVSCVSFSGRGGGSYLTFSLAPPCSRNTAWMRFSSSSIKISAVRPVSWKMNLVKINSRRKVSLTMRSSGSFEIPTTCAPLSRERIVCPNEFSGIDGFSSSFNRRLIR